MELFILLILVCITLGSLYILSGMMDIEDKEPYKRYDDLNDYNF